MQVAQCRIIDWVVFEIEAIADGSWIKPLQLCHWTPESSSRGYLTISTYTVQNLIYPLVGLKLDNEKINNGELFTTIVSAIVLKCTLVVMLSYYGNQHFQSTEVKSQQGLNLTLLDKEKWKCDIL